MLTFESEHTEIQLRTDFFITVTLMLIFCENETVIFSLFSSLLHESGHLASMYLLKVKPEKIIFSATGLKIERRAVNISSFKNEIIIALSGVFVNFILSFVSFVLYFLFGIHKLFLFALVNIVIGLFNLLPLESLDGANVLCFILTRRLGDEKAQKTVMTTSIFTSLFITVFIILTFCLKIVNPSLIIVLLYLIIILINKIFELKKSVI